MFVDITPGELLASPPEGKVLLDFSADWCGPCHQMDTSTWPDEAVVAWMRDNVIAVKVDVDKLPAIAERFNVRAVPTILVLERGQEIGRLIGARPAGELLAWLRQLDHGVTELERLRQAAGTDDSGAAVTRLAAHLRASGDLNGAVDELVAVLDAARDHHKSASAAMFCLGSLARTHPPARRALLDRRRLWQQAGARDLSSPLLVLWIELCAGPVEDRQAVLRWFDDHAHQAPCVEIEAAATTLRRVLIDAGRPVDVARLYVNPVSTIKEMEGAAVVPEGHPASPSRVQELYVRGPAADIIRALVLAGRGEEAETCADIVRAMHLDIDVEPALRTALTGRSS